MKEKLTNTIKRINTELVSRISDKTLKDLITSKLDELDLEIKESYEKYKTVRHIAILNEEFSELLKNEEQEIRVGVYADMGSMIDMIIGIEPNDDDDSVPPLEGAFYGEEWDDLEDWN